MRRSGAASPALQPQIPHAQLVEAHMMRELVADGAGDLVAQELGVVAEVPAQRVAVDHDPVGHVVACRAVAVVISDKGRRARAYGLYQGDGVARDNYPDRIIIFRDTLLRDFGHDPELLRQQVTITVRHELAHHIGFDELGVQGLGL